jgi:hypothetical protein
MRPYVIRQGDYLTKIAHTMGFDAATVWNDPQNEEIRQKRPDWNILHPGDVLWVPDAPAPRKLAIRAGTSNRYVAHIPKMPVRVLIQVGGEPLPKEPYRILGLGPDPVEGETDDDGYVSASVPVHVREIELILTRKNRTLRLRVGDLDPVDTLTGLKKRLCHLGFYQPSRVGIENQDATDDEALLGALKAFQADCGIEPSGRLCEATRKALDGAHGS